MSANQRQNKPVRIYVAAALFSPAERRFNEELCSAIESSCSVYLPQRDGMLVESAVQEEFEVAETVCRCVYAQDIEAIRKSDVVVAVLDGRALDEGVCIEMGYAKALRKVIVGYKSDVRVALPWGHNPIVSGCVDVWINCLDDLSNWLEHFSKRTARGV
jgi:nucleoside 2-deoxyribosyltransferase